MPVNFDGTDDYISTSAITIGSDVATLSFWVNKVWSGSEALFELSAAWGSNDDTFFVFSNGTNFFAGIQSSITTNKKRYEYTAVPSDSQDVHITCVFDNSTSTGYVKVYYDAVEQTLSLWQNDKDQSGVFKVDNLYIGAASAGSTWFSDGTIQDVRIYNRALSDAEIQTVHKSRIGPGNPIQNGLVGYWPMIANHKAYEVVLDGSNDHLSIADSSSVSVTGDITIAVWAKCNTGSTVTEWMVAKWDATLDKRSFAFGLATTSNYPRFQYSDTGSGNVFADEIQTSYDDGRWHLFVVTCDVSAQTVAIYVDGVAGSLTNVFSGTPTSIHDNDTPLYLGALYDNAALSASFDGSMKAVRIWDKILTAAQVAELYHEGKLTDRTAIERANLKLEIPFANPTQSGAWDGDTYPDLSGNGNTGTAVDADATGTKHQISGIDGHVFRDYSGNGNHGVGSDANDSRGQVVGNTLLSSP